VKGPPHPKGRIPETHRDLLRQRLERHVEQHWSTDCGGVLVRFRGPYAYVDALPAERDEPEGLEGDEPGELEPTPLQPCRLGYLGSKDPGPSPSTSTATSPTSPRSCRRDSSRASRRRHSTAPRLSISPEDSDALVCLGAPGVSPRRALARTTVDPGEESARRAGERSEPACGGWTGNVPGGFRPGHGRGRMRRCPSSRE
jgi:hypothetical protein